MFALQPITDSLVLRFTQTHRSYFFSGAASVGTDGWMVLPPSFCSPEASLPGSDTFSCCSPAVFSTFSCLADDGDVHVGGVMMSSSIFCCIRPMLGDCARAA